MPTHRSTALVLAFLAALTSLPAPAQQTPGPVTVAFAARDRFADAVHGLPELQRHLEKQGARHLAAGQSLLVIFTGVDRAGYEKPSGARVVSDMLPARIEIEFALMDASGKRISEGKRSLRSPAYFIDTRALDPLYSEKALLDGWLRTEFGAARS